MNRVDLNQYIIQNKSVFKRLLLRMDKGRTPLCRRRDKTEKEVLLKLDKARWNRWINEGRIEVLSDRRYKLRL